MTDTTHTLNFAAFLARYRFSWVIERIKVSPTALGRFIGIVGGALFLALFTANTLRHLITNVLTLVMICIGTFLLFLCLGMWALLREERYQAQLAKFAVDNHFTFTEEDQITHFNGVFSQLGRKHTFKNRLSGIYQGLPFECGTFIYTVGNGRSERPVQGGLIRVTLSRKVPNVLLDSRKNNLFGLSNMPWMQKMQSLQLEGDFNKYFDLYVPKNYERDALYVLTPELMAILIDHGSSFDIEMVDNYLFIYSKKPLHVHPEQTLRRCFSLIGSIGAEVQENTARYRDANIGARAANAIAHDGRRLKQSRIPTIIKITLLVILLTPFVLLFLIIFIDKLFY